MNDETPRRYHGSLLERAAERYDLLREPRAIPPLPQESGPAPQPQAPLPAAPEGPAPVFDLAEAPRIETPAPAPAAPATQAPGARPRIAIDRARLAEEGLLVPGAPVTALAEEFRLIKRQLLNTARAIHAADREKARMILVCSAKPNDGKTFCAINLALSLAAEKDVEILLVDADFAKPDVLHRLGAPEGPGLLDVLAGTVESAEDCVLDTDIPQLSVLPAGTRTHVDTELLASARARSILGGLAAANPDRLVIFDSPPALAASPAAVLAGEVGQVMLVVRADRTTEADLREAVGLLDGCEQIQLVLNSVSFRPGGYHFGSYGAYYGEADQ